MKININNQKIKSNINKIELEILNVLIKISEENEVTPLEINSALIRLLKNNNDDILFNKEDN